MANDNTPEIRTVTWKQLSEAEEVRRGIAIQVVDHLNRAIDTMLDYGYDELVEELAEVRDQIAAEIVNAQQESE